MSHELDCLQREVIDMAQRIEGFEKWQKTTGGLRVPPGVDDWNRYAQVSEKLDDVLEQIDKLKGQIEEIWEQLEPKDTLRHLKLVVND